MTSSQVRYLNTGNEFVSVPDISTANAGLRALGFIHRGFRACLEIIGSDDLPLLKPTVTVNGVEMFEGGLESELISNWIPSFSARSAGVSARATVIAPLERRGIVCVLELHNTGSESIALDAGWTGCWRTSCVTANVSRMLGGAKYGYISSWNEGVPLIEFRGQTPLFALAFVSEEFVPAEMWTKDSRLSADELRREPVSAPSGEPISYRIASSYTLDPGQTITLPLYVGVGLEEVSAIASAQELGLQGWKSMFDYQKSWLDKHIIECEDPYFQRMLNMNSLYNYFFSQGTTLDTEEVVLTTSRSSESRHCGAYLDRDAMRWSLPALLQMNWAQARKALIHAFTDQLKNVGVRTRFIDGIVLEPGLQLDQLCAPIRALTLYVQQTGDLSVVFDRRVHLGINTIQQILAAQRHPEVTLFETLLTPSGQYSRLPYVCFSNMLVWRVLQDIGWLYTRIRDLDRVEESIRLSNQLKEAILEHFVVDGPNGKMFAQAIDLEGNHIIGDEPAGSLQLMTYFEFCQPDDPIYVNTVNWIHSNMNPMSGEGSQFAAPPVPGTQSPSLISVVNDLLTGRVEEALDFLRRAKLDDGIACATVDSTTGEVDGGRAFASCAGYLAFGLRRALNAICPPTAVVEQKRRPSETLYEPPPEANHDTRKARM